MEKVSLTISDLLDSMEDGFLVLDRAWHMVYLNPAAEQTWGLGRGELAGKNLWVCRPQLVGTQLERQLREAMETGRSNQCESQDVVPERWYAVSTNPHAQGLVVRFSDCTEKKKREQALREQEKHYRDVVQFAPVGIYEVDLPASRFISVNDAVCAMSGYTRDELLAMRPFDLLDQRSQQSFLERLGHIAAGGQPDQNVEYTVIAKDGHAVQALLNTTFLLDEHGKPYGATVVCHDITARKQMEEALRQSEAEFRILFEVPNAGKAEFSRVENHFVRVNQGFCEMTGYSEAELLKMDFVQITHPDDRQADLDAYEAAVRKETDGWKSEKRYIRKDGSLVWVEVRGSVIWDAEGKAIRSYGLVQDITQRKRLAQALKGYAERLEQSNRDLERFAFIASHDLQEPLRKIHTFGSLVQARLGSQMDAESKELLDHMQNAAQRMQKMIDGLLSMSRITTHGQPFVSVNLNHVAEAVVSDLHLRIAQCKGEVIVSELPEIVADPIQMHQLLQNLIINALKFQPPGSVPRVEVRSDLQPPDSTEMHGWVRIFVKDNGIGFDEQRADRIFQPFGRLVGRSEYDGSGIGLAICKKIVDRHGGTIQAASKPGAGSTFVVTLPVTQRKDL